LDIKRIVLTVTPVIVIVTTHIRVGVVFVTILLDGISVPTRNNKNIIAKPVLGVKLATGMTMNDSP
jgi:hypothetical protein